MPLRSLRVRMWWPPPLIVSWFIYTPKYLLYGPFYWSHFKSIWLDPRISKSSSPNQHGAWLPASSRNWGDELLSVGILPSALRTNNLFPRPWDEHQRHVHVRCYLRARPYFKGSSATISLNTPRAFDLGFAMGLKAVWPESLCSTQSHLSKITLDGWQFYNESCNLGGVSYLKHCSHFTKGTMFACFVMFQGATKRLLWHGSGTSLERLGHLSTDRGNESWGMCSLGLSSGYFMSAGEGMFRKAVIRIL